MSQKSQFLIAATNSGAGKTTLTIGLLRALYNRGLKTQPFKCGPDYIDGKYHELASYNTSINLDLFLASQSHVSKIYTNYQYNKDVCIVEGVMGLFDGYDCMEGSSASIAKALDIPVILVINASAMAYSAAAILYGFKNFDKDLTITGVIFNFVGSDSHYQMLKEACYEVGVEPLGYLPKNADIIIPSRHLGLNFDENYYFDEFANKIADVVEKHVDIDRLLMLTKCNSKLNQSKQDLVKGNLKIAVAFDEAFNFIYYENIEALKKLGNVIFFSPLNDNFLPDADFIYIPGGYPELYLNKLSNNKSMLMQIKNYADKGGKMLAECGGMMYLSSCIIDELGDSYSMVGILKQTVSMKNMKLKLGYRQFTYNDLLFKGHEFHYSSVEDSLENITQQYNAKNKAVDTKLVRYKNVIASYTHLYWGEMNSILDIFN